MLKTRFDREYYNNHHTEETINLATSAPERKQMADIIHYTPAISAQSLAVLVKLPDK